MSKSQLIIVLVAGMLLGIAACDGSVPAENANSADSTAQPGKESTGKMKIKIGTNFAMVVTTLMIAACRMPMRMSPCTSQRKTDAATIACHVLPSAPNDGKK